MSDLTITATDVAVVKVWQQLTGPAAEAFSAGEAIRIDTTAGTLTPGNATAAAEARILGIAVTTADAATNSVTVVKKGILDVGEALSALNYDAAIYLSNTDGTLGTAAATVSLVVGKVVPGWGATTADKLLLVDL
ncbi:MAG: hypothetical protein ABIH46_08410 [Chloroflexota bacterium]